MREPAPKANRSSCWGIASRSFEPQVSNTKTWVRSAVVWIGNGIFQSKIWKYMHKIEKNKKTHEKNKKYEKNIKRQISKNLTKSENISKNLKKISKNLKKSQNVSKCLWCCFSNVVLRDWVLYCIFFWTIENLKKSQNISKYLKFARKKEKTRNKQNKTNATLQQLCWGQRQNCCPTVSCYHISLCCQMLSFYDERI